MISNLRDDLQQAIRESLETKFKVEISLLDFISVSGGCINSGGKLSTSHGDYFLKWNDAQRFPQMFQREAMGLELLAASNTVKVPCVINIGEASQMQFLLLEFVVGGRFSKDYWSELGQSLAKMHRCSSQLFGLDHDNYIGSLPQVNAQTDSWIDFFIQQRLAPQLDLAIHDGKLSSDYAKKFERLYQKLSDVLPVEKPVLLHGDLWNGNVMVDQWGNPVLIDPAVYYGHREMDLAFTQLFGGFTSDFYGPYFEEFPVVPGFDERVDIYNLYPLLVHVNLFGGSYAAQVASILNRFV